MCIFSTQLWSLKAFGQALELLFQRKLVKIFDSNVWGWCFFAYFTSLKTTEQKIFSYV